MGDAIATTVAKPGSKIRRIDPSQLWNGCSLRWNVRKRHAVRAFSCDSRPWL